ncbi:MAG TPA: FkbM family methyltransferase [Candidatus Binataceae bacterium]|nr:FkbM family methyltransferase [Candidatus Binataceae bacterium]
MNALLAVLDDRVPTLALKLRLLKYRLGRAAEMAVMRKYVRKGDTVIDIGARRGLFTGYLAALVGRTGCVHAFEPLPQNLAALRANFARDSRVVLHSVALSSREGWATMRVPAQSNGRLRDALGSLEDIHRHSLSAALEVRCQRLDSLLNGLGRPTFIKCDVEGHELEVMRGARLLMAQARPVLLVEIEQRHAREPIATRFAFLARSGYRGFLLGAGGALRALELFDPALEQRVLGRGYANMFVFLPQPGRDEGEAACGEG